MKIALHQIPDGGVLHLEGEEDASFLALEEVKARALSPVRYVLDVGLSDGGLFASGLLRLRLRLECVACLEPFEYDLAVDPFALQKELPGTEIVDLTPEVYDDIQLALPAYPRCDAQAGRSCPAHFPEAASGSVGPPAQPGTWEALDQLKTKD